MSKEELLNDIAADLLTESVLVLGARVITIDKVMNILSNYLEDEEKFTGAD